MIESTETTIVTVNETENIVIDGSTVEILEVEDAQQVTIATLGAQGPTLVSSVFGREGIIIAEANDYTWAQIDKTTSSIKDIADVYSSMTPTDGQVLTYDTTNGWQAENASSGVSTFLALSDTISSYTANRIPFESASAIVDSANFTFDTGTDTLATTNISVGTVKDLSIVDGAVVINSGTLETVQREGYNPLGYDEVVIAGSLSSTYDINIQFLTAYEITGTSVLGNGVTATTQSQQDGSTKVATTAYVDNGIFWDQNAGGYSFLTPRNGVDGLHISGNTIFNEGGGDIDFTIFRQTAFGPPYEAYKYDGGTDTHTFTGQILGIDGLSEPTYSFTSDSYTGMYLHSSETIGFLSGFTNAMTINQSYVNIPINTTATDGYTGALRVQGGVGIGGALYVIRDAVFNDDGNNVDFTIRKYISGDAYKYDSTLDTHTFDGTFNVNVSGNTIIDIQSSATKKAIDVNNGAIAINSDYADLNFAVRAITSGNAVVYDAGTSLWKFDKDTIFNNAFADADFTINKNTSGNAYKYDAGLDKHTFDSIVDITDSTASTNTTTGALIVVGGVGIGGDTFVGGSGNFVGGFESSVFKYLDATTGGANCLFIGDIGNTTNTGGNNTFIGSESGESNTTGTLNTFFGRQSGYSNTTGNSNLFVGYQSGFANITGLRNTFIGSATGKNSTGSDNMMFGSSSGTALLTGNSNLLLGTDSGKSLLNASFNTMIGIDSGENATGSSNVFLGFQSGQNEIESNILIIGNSASSELIRGEFDNDLLTLNAQTIITDTTASTSTTTGSLQIKGGMGIVKDLYVNGKVGIGNGSEGNPSLFFRDDTNTGIYRDSADQMGFTAGGSRRFFIGSGGVRLYNGSGGYPAFRSLGYSNTSWKGAFFAIERSRGTESTPLDVVAGDAIFAFEGKAYQTGGIRKSALYGMYVDTVSASITKGIHKFRVSPDGSGLTDVMTINIDETKVLQSTASTSTTTGALQVSGGVGIVGDTFVGGNITTNGELHFIGAGESIRQSTAQLSTWVGNTEKVRLTSSTAVFFEDIRQDRNGDASSPSYCFNKQTNMGMYRSGNDINLSAQGVQVFKANTTSMTVPQSTTSTSTATGALIVTGGVGIAENLYVGGQLVLSASTTSRAPLNMTVGVAPTTPVAGDLWYEDNHLAFVPVADTRVIAMSTGSIIADTTVANTVTETTIYTSDISANELHADQVVSTRVFGRYSTANATDTFTARLKVGGVTVSTLTSVASNVNDTGFDIEFVFTVRADGVGGSVYSHTMGIFDDSPNTDAPTSAVSIDTTTSNDITLTIEWDSADVGDTVTISQGYTEYLG